MSAHHELMGGKLHLYKRENSTNWQCSAFLNGRNWRVSTKEDSLERAKDFAEDWYLGLRGKARAGELKGGKSFKVAAEQFKKEYEIITLGERSPKYVETLKQKLKVHLTPYFGNMAVTEITPGVVQEYRLERMTKPKAIEEREKKEAEEAKEKRARGEPVELRPPWKPPARTTIHQEIIALRHVLRTAQRHGWLKFLPELSPPYKTSPKISHRAWFSPKEYETLWKATQRRVEEPPHNRWKAEYAQMHDFVLFMANTGLRPDEALRLEYRDVEIITEPGTKKPILEISVRGKRGVGYCKSMPGAVHPFERLKKRNNPQQTDRVFPKIQRELFNTILEEEELKKDREGLTRTAYSLRHTYICLRLLEGADIYQVAKNCRTSVEMIEKYYAAHLKNMIDASAVNVMKKRSNDRKPKGGANAKPRKPRTRNFSKRPSKKPI